MKSMSGVPRPVTDVPNGTVSVRVVRGSLASNLPNEMVDLQAGGRLLQSRTDETGHAQFSGITPGTRRS